MTVDAPVTKEPQAKFLLPFDEPALRFDRKRDDPSRASLWSVRLGAMTEEASDRRRASRVGLEVAVYSILGFWLFYVLIATTQSLITGWGDQFEMAQRRMAVTAAGIVVTFILYFILRRVDERPFGTRIAVAFVAALPAAVAIGLINYYFFYLYRPEALYADQAMIREMSTHTKMWKNVADIATSRYFFLSAWAALYLAISYAAETRDAERRVAGFAQAAKEAEIRALRYQVNPHFLFNTLNSLSSLVMTGRNTEAEAMIMNLSTFYRTSLSGDPQDDVQLAEEVRLQRLYLDIEAVRFPERLRTIVDVPQELMNLCVPGMILQPLVENAIKYGVSRANRPVTISIAARSERGKLVLTVSDDGKGPDSKDEHGTGVGLNNVRDRLQARFGSRAGIVTHVPPGGGFEVTLAMPEVRGGC
jgi:two-component sensor histidine kinase